MSTFEPWSAPGTRRTRSDPDAAQAAAHRGHDAGVAVRSARLGIRQKHARDDPYRHRRRNPRAGGNKRGSHLALSLERLAALARTAPAHRLVGDAKADRRDCAVSGRDVGVEPAAPMRRCRHGTRSPARSRHRGPVVAVAGGDVERGVAGGLRRDWRNLLRRTARRSSSSIRGAWRSAPRVTCPNCSARRR